MSPRAHTLTRSGAAAARAPGAPVRGGAARGRAKWYAGWAAVASALCACILAAPRGSADAGMHGLTVLIGGLAALVAAATCLVRVSVGNDRRPLLIGLGFLVVGVVAAVEGLARWMRLDLAVEIGPWQGVQAAAVAARALLGLLCVGAAVAGRALGGVANPRREAVVLPAIVAGATFCAALVPWLAPGAAATLPGDACAGSMALFIAGAALYAREYVRSGRGFFWWIATSCALNAAADAAMLRITGSSDYWHNLAHLLATAGYLAPSLSVSTDLAGMVLALHRKKRQLVHSKRKLQHLSDATRRFNVDLERAVATRTTELRHANERLQGEVVERRRAEDVMARTAEALEKANRALKENQARMIHTEKMASIGQIAAGVAHEINNPIGFVMSNLSTLRTYSTALTKLLAEYNACAEALRAGPAGADPRIAESLERIDALKEEGDIGYVLEDLEPLLSESHEGAVRVKEIVQNLKSFARPDETSAREVDLNECVESTLKLVWNELKYKCRLQKKLAPLPRLRCYPGQLNQVLMNLLVNAAQSIAEKGEVTVETAVEGEEIVVRVRDTGCGIAPELQARVFEPFFTTKGVGTGLGLSISLGIVEKHHGKIELESRPGQGTEFTVRLPLTGVPDEANVNLVR
jgi:signal transduction histidine kinase